MKNDTALALEEARNNLRRAEEDFKTLAREYRAAVAVVERVDDLINKNSAERAVMESAVLLAWPIVNAVLKQVYEDVANDVNNTYSGSDAFEKYVKDSGAPFTFDQLERAHVALSRCVHQDGVLDKPGEDTDALRDACEDGSLEAKAEQVLKLCAEVDRLRAHAVPPRR